MQFPKQMAIRKAPCCFCNKTIKKNSKTPGIKLECNLKNTWHKIGVQIEL